MIIEQWLCGDDTRGTIRLIAFFFFTRSKWLTNENRQKKKKKKIDFKLL
jgi:hypothetical protein